MENEEFPQSLGMRVCLILILGRGFGIPRYSGVGKQTMQVSSSINATTFISFNRSKILNLTKAAMAIFMQALVVNKSIPNGTVRYGSQYW